MSGLFGSSTSTTDTKLSSVSLQQSTYGIAIPLVYGKQRVSTNIIDYVDFKAVPHTTSSGGKGGSSSSSTSYTYTVSMMLALGEGPLSSTGVVWKSSTEYTLGDLGIEFYSGTDTQSAWSYMLSNHSDRAIPYRGIAYAASQNYDLSSSASLPNLSFEVYGVKSQGSILNGDALINEVMVDILTNSRYGAGFPSARIGDLTDLRNYTLSNGLLISPQYTSQTKANQIITDLCKIANSQPVWSQGKMKVIPYSLEASTGNGATFNPSTDALYDLTDDDFIVDDNEDPIEIQRSDTEDAYNYQEVEFRDRANDYNTDQEAADDLANIELQGKRTADVVSLDQICERSVAKKVAQNILNRELYVRNTYTFKLSWKYCLSEPMDIITLTNSFLGLNRTPVRIETIEDADDFTLTLTAVDVFDTVSGITTYASQSADRAKLSDNLDPGSVNQPVIFEPPDGVVSGLQVLLGVSWINQNCGGCTVWLSSDDESYLKIGSITNSSRQGVLYNALPAGSDPDTTNVIDVDLSMSNSVLSSVTQTNADNYDTLCYVDGELVSYETSTLKDTDKYELSYIRRGLYGTTNEAHISGSQFLRLDPSCYLLHSFTEEDIGKTLYIKFASYNIFGAMSQSLADVPEYKYKVTGSSLYSPLPVVTGLSMSFQNKRAVLSWDMVSDYRTPILYEIRMGDTFSTATVLGQVSTTSFICPSSGTFWIAAVYKKVINSISYSAYSLSWVDIDVTMATLISNVVATYDEKATGWLGSKSSYVEVDPTTNSLRLVSSSLISSIAKISDVGSIKWYGDVASQGTYTIPDSHIVSLSSAQSVTLSCTYLIKVVSAVNLVSQWTKVTSMTSISGDDSTKGGATVQVNIMDNLGVYAGWQDFYPGDYYGKSFIFRIILNSNDTQYTVYVKEFAISVDVPDINESNNVVVPTTGLTVVYSSSFNMIPTPVVSIYEKQAGDTDYITNQTKNGFTISITNNGTAVSREINYVAVGW